MLDSRRLTRRADVVDLLFVAAGEGAHEAPAESLPEMIVLNVDQPLHVGDDLGAWPDRVEDTWPLLDVSVMPALEGVCGVADAGDGGLRVEHGGEVLCVRRRLRSHVSVFSLWGSRG